MHLVWEGVDTTQSYRGILRIEFPSRPFPTREVKIEPATKLMPGFNRIDALKIIGHAADGEVGPFFEQVSKDDVG